MTKDILFIYNPNSGKGKISRYRDDIIDILAQSGRKVVPYETKASLDALNEVQTHAQEYSMVVCAGGDGTLSEVVSGMMQLEEKVPIGFIPAGSTNDTRPGFGLPKDILEAARLCINGTPFLTDVGRFNEEYFTYVASLGSISAVSCFTSQDLKRIFGHGAYWIEAIKQVIKMESYDMEVEFGDTRLQGEFVLGLVMNAVCVGGFEGISGRSVDLADGVFEVALIKKPQNILEIGRAIDLMLIHNKEEWEILDDVVIRFKTDKLTIRSDKPVQWVRDGENGGKHKTAEIEVCPRAVTIMSSKLTGQQPSEQSFITDVTGNSYRDIRVPNQRKEA